MNPTDQANYQRIIDDRNTRRAELNKLVARDWQDRTRDGRPLRVADTPIGPSQQGHRR